MNFKNIEWSKPQYTEQNHQEITKSMELEMALADLEMSLERIKGLIEEGVKR